MSSEPASEPSPASLPEDDRAPEAAASVPRAFGPRVVSSLARALAATACVLPLALLLLAAGEGTEAVQLLGAVAVFFSASFLAERRDASMGSIVGRTAAAGAAAGALVPVTLEWLGTVGDPVDGYARLARSLGSARLLEATLGSALGLGAVSLLGTGWLFHMRARTERLLPQLAVGGALASWCALLSLAVVSHQTRLDPDLAWVLPPVLLAGLLLPLGPWWLDGRLAGWDATCPRPRGGDPAPVVEWLLLVLALLLIPAVQLGSSVQEQRPPLGAGASEAYAAQTLERIHAAQARFRADDADGDGQPHYAASLRELADSGWRDDPRLAFQGTRHGYVFRLLRSSRSPARGWMAAGARGPPGPRRSFVTNHTGEIHATASGPIPLDPEGCTIPPSLRLVGR